MNTGTSHFPQRRQILIGAAVVISGAALAALGLDRWRGAETRPTSKGAPNPELDALADAVVSGGPGRDGIPPIDEPQFVTADAASFLGDDEPVFGLNHRGQFRAYPQQVLVWHEVVNAVVGGEALSVTYCPLTGTVIAFASPPGEVWTFGTTGRLVNSNLLMYDRQTESEWPQILGVAISGSLKGTRAATVPLVWTTWRAWSRAHPETLVLSTATGALRRYGSDPYGSYPSRTGYYFEEGTIFPVQHSSDRYGAKDVIVGIRAGQDRCAVLKSLVRQNNSVRVSVGGITWIARWDNDLDAAVVVNAATNEPADYLEAMWFAWYAFYPETTLV